MQKVFIVVAVVFASFIAWAIYSANTSANNFVFDYIRGIPNGDKWGHFFLFGLLAFFVNLALKLSVFKVLGLPVFYGSFFVSLFVVAEELTQILIPSRTFDLVDLYADAIGILLFTMLSYIPRYFLIKNN